MVDTEPLAQRAWQQVLTAYGYTLDDALYAQMIGRRTDQSAQMLLDACPLPLTAVELIQRKTEAFVAIRAAGVPMMPGLPELVAALAARDIPWGVATSSPQAHALATLRQLQWEDVCQAVAAGDEVTQGKPAPDIYLLAAARMGMAPERCLALEDSAPGCEAALAAGMQVVAVPNGFTKMADFSFVPLVVDSLHDVVAQLDVLVGGTAV
ncbi:MAG: HAD family phosphatase [Anaerolineales bacterium]|nr:HAD family phosphatase [Anaerolineales bacterium]MCB8966315.1 HAD family phosphatase [Ardenticatenaceae bacterium]